jgi:isoquinoline 1-oxidoreductase
VGAEILGSSVEDCIARRGKILDTVLDVEISYSEILSETAISHTVEEEDLAQVVLKELENYEIIGKSLASLDSPEKVNGSARFGIDAYVPNMIYGKIIGPPVRMWARVKSITIRRQKILMAI